MKLRFTPSLAWGVHSVAPSSCSPGTCPLPIPSTPALMTYYTVVGRFKSKSWVLR